MPGNSFSSMEMVRLFEQLKDCLTKCKDSKDYARMTYCIDEAKRVSDAIRYSDCISNSKYMYQFTECSEDITKECRRGNFTLPQDFRESFEKIDKGFDKLLNDLENVLANQDLMGQLPEDFLKDESVKLVFNDVALLHCDLMRYYDQIDLLVEIFNGLSYTGFLCGSLILTVMFIH